MSVEAVVVKCPTCGSTVDDTGAGEKQCEFCLTVFTVTDSRREQQKRQQEIRRWLEGHLGSLSIAGAAVDSASRSYIFNERIRPALEREVNRALEGFGNYQQAPVVRLPAPLLAAQSRGNPLVERHEEILRLNSIRARFESPDVTSFANGEREQGALRMLQRRLEDIILLSNAARASHRNDTPDYKTTRKNLQELLNRTDLFATSENSSQPDLPAYLSLLKERYRIDIEMARIAEELASSNPISGAALVQRVLVLDKKLEEVAGKLMACTYSPGETMSVVMGINEERKQAGLLVTWLRAYDVIGQISMMSFKEFWKAMENVGTGILPDPVQKAQLLAGMTEFVRIMRGEKPAFVLRKDAELGAWLENQRERKFLGLFGNEEHAEQVRHFYLAIWIVDVGFSKSSGVIFVEGCEQRCLAVVDACSPTTDRVVFLEGPMAKYQRALTNAGSPPSGLIVFPRASAEVAESHVRQAARNRQDMQNIQVKARTIGFVPAISAVMRSVKGDRSLAAILGGTTLIDPKTAQIMDATSGLVERFALRK